MHCILQLGGGSHIGLFKIRQCLFPYLRVTLELENGLGLYPVHVLINNLLIKIKTIVCKYSGGNPNQFRMAKLPMMVWGGKHMPVHWPKHSPLPQGGAEVPYGPMLGIMPA